MYVLLVGPDLEENLSLAYLAAALQRAGHRAEQVPFEHAGQLPEVLRRAAGADLVGLSMAFQARAREFLRLARALRRAGGPPVVAGGHYASCAAEELLAHHPEIDAVVLHEGEQSLVELADQGADPPAWTAVPGLVLRTPAGPRVTAVRPIEPDLTAFPRPLRAGPVRLLAGVPTAYLLGSRGCLGDCHYCCIQTLHRLCPGPRFRQRPADDVAAELADLYHGRGIRQFVFHDDNFLVPSQRANRARLAALRHGLRARGVGEHALVIKCRPQEAERGILEELRDMGLIRLFMGVESATPEGLASLGRRQAVADSERALDLCDHLGISSQFGLMVFHPDATLAGMRADIDFLRRFAQHPTGFARAEIYAGTPLERRMLAEGRATGDYLARGYPMAEPALDRAFDIVTALLQERCWAHESLLQRVIGMDHLAATLARFYPEPEAQRLVADIHVAQLEVNTATIDILAAVVDLAARATPVDPAWRREVETIAALERADRERAWEVYRALGARLDAFVAARTGLDQVARGGMPSGRLARHAAVVLGLVATVGVQACGWGVCEYMAPHTGIYEREPDIEVEPGSWAFGARPAGETDTAEISVDNLGRQTLEISSIAIEPAEGPFLLTSATSLALEHLQHATIAVSFTPAAAGEFSAELVIRSNDPDEEEVRVLLTGEGLAP
ncbi:MAG: cobalamin-dependent protein [Pseudomonadota bacterium]